MTGMSEVDQQMLSAREIEGDERTKYLTVAEVIAKLQECDPSSMVITRGYEDGAESPLVVRPTTVHYQGPDTPHYYGVWAEVGTYGLDTSRPAVGAVFIG